ncbi:DNA-binding transcriptional regulator, MarR family [Lutimaribacter pacificus]|uniref:DNA-binding transcriptional regulator, MarR family n=1 Tax=Lutimaribacter pacificus TaxID=391948 RepID=A0A1H0BZ79_9RHOB|nr:MarR family winged helix-turn-helix transcriptional regulator [Lutimaribacter pacificus]SDN50862.1 DNA-binding transcriptional regulator, MarR family [Lutimaribacter pacificus]SHJ50726.1 DNA-binding transcriptional regulator, MarR family [Lutimaribacter pacificus]
MPDHDEDLKRELAQAGIGEDLSRSALELDAIMQHWRRKVVKRELGQRALADLGLDLDLPLLDVLTVIWTPANEFGDVPDGETMVSTVATRLGIDPSRSSRLTSELIRLGLVRRAVSQEDARRAVLELTDEGNRVIRAVRHYKFLILGSFLKDWSDEELEVFIPLLERFSEWSEASEDPTGRIAAEISRLRESLTDPETGE